MLGIVSIAMCAFTGPFAWSMGNKALREIDAEPWRYSNRSSVVAGRIMGIFSSLLVVLVLAFVVLAVVIGLVGSSSTPDEPRPLERIVYADGGS